MLGVTENVNWFHKLIIQKEAHHHTFIFFFPRVDGLRPPAPAPPPLPIECIKEWKLCFKTLLSLSLALICFLLFVSLLPLFLCLVSFTSSLSILPTWFLAMSYLQFVIETLGTMVCFCPKELTLISPKQHWLFLFLVSYYALFFFKSLFFF